MSQIAAFAIGLGVGTVIGIAGAWFYRVQELLAWHLRNPPRPPDLPPPGPPWRYVPNDRDEELIP